MTTIAAPAERLTDDEYERLSKLGAFGDRRTELIGGKVVEMNATHTLHALTRDKVAWMIRDCLIAMNSPLSVIQELSVRFGGGFYPLPDVLVWDMKRLDGAVLGPEAKLIVEVADDTLTDDLGVKRAHYAAAGLPEYWVVDVRGHVVHQFAAPRDGAYAAALQHAYGARIASLTLPGVVVDTSALPSV
ncbi:MAG: Uma2 family endonuclease [Alphaproteobacteria bacterium]|nr:Uma2 family endonuclease [Alphaproteobacteria bacterium]